MYTTSFIFWIIVVVILICIAFFIIILNIKRTIYETLSRDVNIEYSEELIYPSNFNIDNFNIEIYKYLINLLINFNKEISNESYIMNGNIYYLYFGNKKIGKMILDNNNYLWFVIRGTLTYNEFEYDLKISQVNINETIKCHQGFYEIYSNIKSDMIDIISYISPKKIFCLGHSLGGGILTIASYDLFKLFNKNNICIFIVGTPRVCNENLSNYVNEFKFFNIQNISDIYVNIIPAILPFYHNVSYDKSGEIILFNHNTNNVILNHTLEIYLLNIHNYKKLKPLIENNI
ncbi:ORF MSV048 putative lipase, similar to Rhizopus niveus lipase GB:D12680 [Melanoplus sanguinipes entomopoxvirus]|uniref:ORF MSV048 putative lipase, similar to Rhizopus niveus lipase GB:D12680 n=1 Tax=Melanoplus sanguinipes entomopoxvirus TaxID=83191 RepID=Q9YW44_MSEPV|nr:ORF MSV048 putative lipase, similar to Rhizopus niveus lipase GB:D12680 [Melanoplus sanguinipes entomopoxvirus]AAC97828.1 ORF MSV048 putative lipase, similar to Rhizopus niveus lipase GB:D12680 [Melanoplus sanguinipes entomopoxvirus 'O']